jgi:hypothetical protein
MQTLIESLQKELIDISRIHDLHQLKAIYLGKKGYVSIIANENGIRNVTINFTKN